MDAKPFPGSLCHRCRHLRLTENARGSVFMLCAGAKDDPRLTKYPPQPVARCVGFSAAEAS